MKIIEAMKRIKELQQKRDDLQEKIGKHCADLTLETPVYPDQPRQVREWLQAHFDIGKEVLALRMAILRTNLATSVDMQIGGKTVTRSIAEWIHRRRDLADQDMAVWQTLGNRGLREQNVQTVKDGPVTEVRIRRYFDPSERDRKVEEFRSEPGIIDRTLEVVNATTEVIGV